jgi:hypothetical protein
MVWQVSLPRKNKTYLTSLEEQLWSPLLHAVAAIHIEELVELLTFSNSDWNISRTSRSA